MSQSSALWKKLNLSQDILPNIEEKEILNDLIENIRNLLLFVRYFT